MAQSGQIQKEMENGTVSSVRFRTNIAPDFILTAKHCIDGVSPGAIQVVAGITCNFHLFSIDIHPLTGKKRPATRFSIDMNALTGNAQTSRGMILSMHKTIPRNVKSLYRACV
jgi:hypothetical protein